LYAVFFTQYCKYYFVKSFDPSKIILTEKDNIIYYFNLFIVLLDMARYEGITAVPPPQKKRALGANPMSRHDF